MNRNPMLSLSLACAGALWPLTTASAQYVERTFEVVRAPSDVQVLTSGPVHEAFAETVVYDPEPDVVVLMPPPEPINEEPPDIVPDGPDITWIPGYWAWDDDRDDYLWISGIWRSVPPGRSYVPGFWSRIGHGYQWSSGFWIDADAVDLDYLPDPPERIEEAPPPYGPSPNLIWTPGIWVWDMDRYVWRPGHWVEATPDWVWVPAHYVWSPRGYVFVDGYWDMPIEQRGVLFAPVYVTPVVRQSPTFVYAPQLVIDLDIFTDHLFVRPRYRHYYFGDFYAASYVDRGIYPWFAVQSRRVAYDPIYVHRRWHHRHEPDWERHVQVSYDRRRDNERERPPRTYNVNLALGGETGALGFKGQFMAKTLQQMAQANRSRFRQVQGDERNNISMKAKTSQKARAERKATESVETGGTEPVKRTTPTRAKMPTPTVTSKKDAPTNKGPAPKKPDAPTADRNVAPKPKAKVEKKTTTPKSTPPADAKPAVPAEKAVPPPKDEPKPPPVRFNPPPKAEPAQPAQPATPPAAKSSDPSEPARPPVTPVAKPQTPPTQPSRTVPPSQPAPRPQPKPEPDNKEKAKTAPPPQPDRSPDTSRSKPPPPERPTTPEGKKKKDDKDKDKDKDKDDEP